MALSLYFLHAQMPLDRPESVWVIAFTRAYRDRIGQPPAEFRKSPDWEQWFTALGPLTNARTKS